MPSSLSLSPDNVLRFLQLRRDPASPTDIARGLHLRNSDTRLLFKMLAKLKKRRAIEELPGGRYRLPRSEEHTSELQSPCNLVCRLLLEKKKNKIKQTKTKKKKKKNKKNKKKKTKK